MIYRLLRKILGTKKLFCQLKTEDYMCKRLATRHIVWRTTSDEFRQNLICTGHMKNLGVIADQQYTFEQVSLESAHKPGDCSWCAFWNDWIQCRVCGKFNGCKHIGYW